MNLSRNFSLSELTKSDTAIRKGINNNPNAEQVEKLKLLCENILQPVERSFWKSKSDKRIPLSPAVPRDRQFNRQSTCKSRGGRL